MRNIVVGFLAIAGLAVALQLLLPGGVCFDGPAKGDQEVPVQQKEDRPPWSPSPLRVRQSKPVEANEASFTVVAETEWWMRKDRKARPLDIQLHIKNLAKDDVLFHTFDTFNLWLKKADGSEVRPTGGRNGTIVTPPVIIAPGESYAICRKTELRWDPKAKASELVFWDGTGTIQVYGPLSPGRYSVAFWYGAAVNNQTKMIDPDGAVPMWVGSVKTAEITVDVSER